MRKTTDTRVTPCRSAVEWLLMAFLAMATPTLATAQAGSSDGAADSLVDLITGQDASAENYDARYRAAEALPGKLSRDRAVRLIEWLMEPGDPLPPQAAAAIRNAVAGRLIQTQTEPAALADALLTAFRDPRQSEVWRDYCLQHTGSLLRRLDGDRADAALDTLWAGTKERAGALAGTALIALQRNIEHGVPQERVADQAVAIAANPALGGGSRATALQVLAEFGDARALPPARAALGSSRDLVLRLAALNVVGAMGEFTDKGLVERYVESSIPVLRTAAVSARSRLVTDYE